MAIGPWFSVFRSSLSAWPKTGAPLFLITFVEGGVYLFCGLMLVFRSADIGRVLSGFSSDKP
jgi:hypothetical protein